MRVPAALAAALLAILAACAPPHTQTYDNAAWGFRADFEEPPVVREAPATPDGTHPRNFLAESTANGRDLAVSVTDASLTKKDIDELSTEAEPMIAKSMGGDPGPKAYVATAEGTLGREFAIMKNGSPMMMVRVFLANGRYYQIGAKSVLGVDDPAAKAFLDSFHITGAAAAAANGASNAN
jgi:hypothetical protein